MNGSENIIFQSGDLISEDCARILGKTFWNPPNFF